MTRLDEMNEAFECILSEIGDLRVSVDDRLEELDFDDESYEEGSNDEIGQLLELRDKLNNLDFYS